MNRILHPNIDVVILCGGFGTRLQGIIDDRPKPMVEVAGRPFLDILIDHVMPYGLKRIILCTGHKSEFIERYYKGKHNGATFMFSVEKEPLGTAGAIKNAEPFIQSEMFLVLNGDSFCRTNINSFLAFHKSKGTIASIVLAVVEGAADYGAIKLKDNERIASFSEKIYREEAGYVNAGIYAFDKTILKQIPTNKKLSLEYDLFPRIIDAGIYGYISDGRLLDIGTPQRLQEAREYFK